jgi:hypothetical protein
MKTVIADEQFSDSWKQLIEEANKIKRKLAPNEMTRNEFCSKTSMSIDEADRFINKLVKEGKAEIDYLAVDGHTQKIFRLLE